MMKETMCPVLGTMGEGMSLTLRGRKDDADDDADVVNEVYRGHVDDEGDDVYSSGHDGGGHVADGGGKETGC